MTTNDMPDPILRLLAHLPSAAPSGAVDQRVRFRCHHALEKQRSRAQRSAAATSARVIDAALAMTAGIYAAAVAVEALRLAGML